MKFASPLRLPPGSIKAAQQAVYDAMLVQIRQELAIEQSAARLR